VCKTLLFIGATILSIKTLSITTFSVKTLSITTFKIKTLSIMAPNLIKFSTIINTT
jgi:hypothetical protein